MGKLFFCAAFI